MSTSLLNQKNTRTLALRLAQARGSKFTRVSKTFLDRIDGKVRTIIAAEIHAMPSSGKTIQ